MTGVGVLGILLGLLAFRVAFLQVTGGRIIVLAGAYAVHLIASYVFYQRALTYGGDAFYYYYDPYGTYAEGFGLSTVFVIYVVQAVKDLIGGSYYDYFLLFQWMGFLGMALLIRILDECSAQLGRQLPLWCYAILFIPSLHFWSSSLGKDSPMILAVAAALWATIHMQRRFVVLVLAFLLMLLIRPHIALIVGLSLSVATIIGRGMSPLARVGLLAVAGGGMMVAFYSVQATFNIDVTSSESVDTHYERITQVLGSDDAGNTAVTGNFAVRLISLLFRPFFFDANESFAILASFESMIYMVMLAILIRHTLTLVQMFRQVLFVRFALVLTIAMIAFLTLSYFNVGLGLRQKWTMLFPSLLVVFGVLRVLLASRGDVANGTVTTVPPVPAVPSGDGAAVMIDKRRMGA